jgi:hypothetical protein
VHLLTTFLNKNQELNEILVQPLPVGCFLLASDAWRGASICCSVPGDANRSFFRLSSILVAQFPYSIYRTSIVIASMSHGGRREGMLCSLCEIIMVCPPEFFIPFASFRSIADVMTLDTNNALRSCFDPLLLLIPRSRIGTEVGRSADAERSIRRWRSLGDSEAHLARKSRKYVGFLSPTRYDSPAVSNVMCDGWCEYDPFAPRITVNMMSFLFCMRDLTNCMNLCKLAVVVYGFESAPRSERSSGISNDSVMQISW